MDIGGWASIVSLVLQLWGKATDRKTEATQASDTWNEIIQGTDKLKAQPELLNELEERLAKKLSAETARSIAGFARLHLSLSKSWDVKQHDHWSRLQRLTRAISDFCKQSNIFTLLGEGPEKEYLRLPRTGDAFWSFIKPEIVKELLMIPEHDSILADVNLRVPALMDCSGSDEPLKNDLPVFLICQGSYERYSRSGYQGKRSEQRGVNIYISKGSGRNRLLLRLVLGPFRGRSRSTEIRRSCEIIVSAGQIGELIEAMGEDLVALASRLEDDKVLLQEKIDPRIQDMIRRLTEKV